MFTIGFMPGITVTSAVRAMQTRHPDLEVRLLRTDWFNQVEVLHDGRVDVSVVRLPVAGCRWTCEDCRLGSCSTSPESRSCHPGTAWRAKRLS
jgi:DNA-binding transcriptional LysR family regulator